MSIAHRHAEWLSLVEISGPFLSMPVLMRAFPQGLEGVDAEVRRLLRVAYEEWQETQDDGRYHAAWIEWVLREGLGLPSEVLHQPSDENGLLERFAVQVLEHQELLSPDWVVMFDDDMDDMLKEQQAPRLLVMVVPPGQGLERVVAGRRWKASPATRMMVLLHAKGVRLGLLTNGERWMLVDAPKGQTTAFVSWYASLWLEEALTWQSFQTLLGVRRFFGVPEEETLSALLADSANDQQEVTNQLGEQVRRAVELLIQAWDKADEDAGRRLLANVFPARLYEAALTVMMRLVFLLSAEERGLLLLGDLLYDEHYAVSTLRIQLRERADHYGEAVLERKFDAWPRLLALFAAVYGGIQHDRLSLPAYGGSLFDPQRFPFLMGQPSPPAPLPTLGEGSKASPPRLGGTEGGRGGEPIRVSNRTVLHMLEALQLLQVSVSGQATARRLSFRALDVEQIGHLYEGLLDHRAQRAESAVLGLRGTKNKQPELPLSTLEAERAKGEKSFLTYLKGQTGRSQSPLRKGLKIKVRPERFEAGRLRVACGNDEALYERVVPFYGLLRMDSYGTPLVVPAGSLYVTAGEERRATGAHYTPRSLTEPIVQHTLEPLVYNGPNEGQPRDQWRLRPLSELLDLKICDMAMGSGAFLVQACRYLSERVVEAWDVFPSTGSGGGKATHSTPPEPVEGGSHASQLLSVASTEEERLAMARRLVADRCLYGVDKNPLAVEMAKLSLWLITLNKGQPFTFLDHALKCGDSLIGVDLQQLINWNLAGSGARELVTEGIRLEIEGIIELRRQIAATPVINPEDQRHKAWLLHQADAGSNNLRTGGDLLIGSYYNDLSKKEQAYLRTSLLYAFRDGKDVPPERAELADLGDLRPFHWPLEFPEVFISPEKESTQSHSAQPPRGKKEQSHKGGFDAFVGNPPFMGGSRIRGALGGDYLQYLKTRWDHTRGLADISAYFFLRAFENLRTGGTLGLIATNTIAQGDTRVFGLDYIHQQGGQIYRATNNQAWLGQAAVVVNVVHLYKGDYQGRFVLDGLPTKRQITPMLDDLPMLGPPHKLAANANKSFKGSEILGLGFTMPPEEAQTLIRQDSRNAEVLFPFLNGQDLNSYPDQSPSRWVISFSNWPLQRGAAGSWLASDKKQRREWLRSGTVPNDYPDPVAADYPDCLAIVKEKVYPERQKNRNKQCREIWWRFHRTRAALYQTIAPQRRVLVVARVSKTVAFVFVAKGWVYSDQIVAFSFEEAYFFIVLQSTLHTQWALKYASSLKGDLRYSPTDAFQTFPFPHPTPEQEEELERIGERYHELRREIMLEREEGLTKTYNRFHDPDEEGDDIAELRALHVEMDEAVAAAYGWHAERVVLNHDFHETAQGLRFTISDLARREVLGRLLELNHARYAEEVKAGRHQKKKKTSKTKRSKKKKGKETPQMSLF
ncbi:MAG: Eco57I restriction-modification methylase domain-containing protein [Ardenticatenaceae bacterium]